MEMTMARKGVVGAAFLLSGCAGAASVQPPVAPAQAFANEGSAGAAPQLRIPQRLAPDDAQSQRAGPCLTRPCIYVTNVYPNYSYSVTAYRTDANGNVAPIQDLHGSMTQLWVPTGAILDSDGDLYVTNWYGSGSVTEPYPGGSMTEFGPGADGNVKPIREIIGFHTRMSQPTGVGVGARGEIYVVSSYGVTVYAKDARGDARPIRQILPDTGLPIGMTLGPDGVTYVVNQSFETCGPGSVTVYGPGAHGKAKPIRTISGPVTGLFASGGIALDASGRIYVTNGSCLFSSITVYAKRADGNVEPIREISGSKTTLHNPSGIAVDASGKIYVSDADRSRGRVLVYAAGANGNVAPSQVIEGKKSRLSGPRGIAVH
jgi:hypothetical protein